VTLDEGEDLRPNDLEMLFTDPSDIGHLRVELMGTVLGMLVSMHWVESFRVDIC